MNRFEKFMMSCKVGRANRLLWVKRNGSKCTNMIEVDELREELYHWLERGESWEVPSVAWIHDLDEVEAVLSRLQLEDD